MDRTLLTRSLPRCSSAVSTLILPFSSDRANAFVWLNMFDSNALETLSAPLKSVVRTEINFVFQLKVDA
ncbi:MAG TPA: hypothetical protein PLM52_04480 [Tabrizicola sp.]|nr:hypothetical protein [Tabrizicola sp.]